MKFQSYRKKIRLGGLVVFLIFLSFAISAQISNVRQRKLYASSDSLKLDTLSIIPGSLSLKYGNNLLSSDSYFLDEINAILVLNDSSLRDTIVCNYRVFPAFLGEKTKNKSTQLITKEYKGAYVPYVIGGSRPTENLLDDKGLQKSGSISRGILFGNNQNLSVNSTLNLQLSGKVNDRFNILASITDDNIPIQPDGNTQQLQDFDQVFIQLYDDRIKLIAGDFQLRKPAGYFLNYFKRAQGAYFLSSSLVGNKQNRVDQKLTVEASASISKGRFGRNVIQGIEGNQGPYRLKGADNELFIIVLSGTEQVFIDGRLLQRGLDKDYVIDYNAAEIVFTPKQFITKDRRIVVEFQYSEKRYARPLIQTALLYEKNKNKFYFNFFSENDAKNQSLQQDLSDTDKGILVNSGDNFLSAYSSGVDSTGYNNNQVQYAMTDSLGYDSVFVYSTDSLLAKYRVSFSFVGSGNGDYVEDGFTANGRKFKWVQPVLVNQSFVHQGTYAPIILLAAPKKTQMLTAGSEFYVNKEASSRVLLEGALSNKDLNTFSKLDAQDDLGYAVKAAFKWNRPDVPTNTPVLDTVPVTSHHPTLNGELFYEHTSKYFNQIERFREVEFNRNWNVQLLNLADDQHISGGMFGTKIPGFGSAAIGGDVFFIGDSYAGYKAKWTSVIATKNKWNSTANASYLLTTGQVNSRFVRHKAIVSKEVGKLKVYYKDDQEHNLYYRNNSDTLATNSYSFFDWEVGAGSADTMKRVFNVYYRDRLDNKPSGLGLNSAARADQYGATAGIKGKKDSRLNVNVSNRRLHVIDPELFTQSPENTLLTRIEYSFKVKEGFIQNTTFYEIGSGLEQKREFIYLEVPAGQGVYVWNDYNKDGVKNLNEFEVAQFGYEANYIRSFVQSNDYIKTFSNQFNQTLTITPAKILKKDTRTHKFISRFSNNASLRIERKTTREERKERLNPFVSSIADSSLLSLNELFRNILFFNKSNPSFGLDHTYQFAGNKNLLSNGFESRGDNYNQVGLRWNFIHEFTFFMENRMGKKVASSNFLSGRNYELHYFSIQPKLTWQPNTTGRLNLIARYAEKQNVLGNENAVIRKIGFDLTLNSIEKGSFQAEINFYSIRYDGANNNSLSFDMLEGLNAGYNFTWSAGLQRTIAKNLQMNLLYNARKPQDMKAIHSGSVQVRALF